MLRNPSIRNEENETRRSGSRFGPEKGFFLINNGKLELLYAAMLKCRALEERSRALRQPWRIAAEPSAIWGHEAIEVGCAIDLRAEDIIVAPQRSWIAGFIHGLPSEVALLQSTAANARGRPSSSDRHKLKPICYERIGAGLAMAKKIKARGGNDGRVVVAFSGLASIARRDESIAVAARHSLPVVFVDRLQRPEGNSGIAVQRASGPGSDLHNLPSISVDAQDVVAVYRVAHEAIRRARRNGGPTRIVCELYRLESAPAADAMPGVDTLPDPLKRMEEYLVSKGLFNPAGKRRLIQNFVRQLDAAAPIVSTDSLSLKI